MIRILDVHDFRGRLGGVPIKECSSNAENLSSKLGLNDCTTVSSRGG